jgi:glycosyltransferase involved in cell wall biosynthesis
VACDLSVSVIVPTYNRCRRLERMLRALEREYQAGTRFEVVVVVDGATDGTEEMLASLSTSYPLRVLTQANSGPAAARNRAVGAAGGDVLMFLDDDVIPVEGMIERHLEVHRRDDYAVVTGPMAEPPGMKMPSWLRWEAVILGKQYAAMTNGLYRPGAPQFFTANASARRKRVLAAGGFDEHFKRAEDVELAYRMADQGARFYFEPEAAVLHEPDRTFPSWMKVFYEYGRHDVLMARLCGRTFILERAYGQWHSRHPLNKLAMRLCVGYPWRVRLLIAGFTPVLKYRGPGLSDRVQMAMCSAVSNVQYWQGLADATGLGPRVWQELARWAEASRTERAPTDVMR